MTNWTRFPSPQSFSAKDRSLTLSSHQLHPEACRMYHRLLQPGLLKPQPNPAKQKRKLRGQLWRAHVVSWKRLCVTLGDSLPQYRSLPQLLLPTVGKALQPKGAEGIQLLFPVRELYLLFMCKNPALCRSFCLQIRGRSTVTFIYELEPEVQPQKSPPQRSRRNVESHQHKAKSELPKITQLESLAPEDS